MCDCIEKFNSALESKNTRLVATLILDRPPHPVATILTEKIRSLRDGKKAVSVVATYCPFCGTAYAAPDDEHSKVRFTHEELKILSTVMADRGGWPAVDTLVRKLAEAVS